MFELNYTIQGNGKTIVLLPGLLASTRYWDEISSELAKDFRIIAIDQLGFGKSPKPDLNTDYSIKDNIDAYKSTFDKLNIKEIDLMIGFSSSTVLSSAFVNKYPYIVKKLLLISPPAHKSREEALAFVNNSFRTYKYMMNTNWKYFFIPFVTIFRPLLILFAPLYITHVRPSTARDVFKFSWKSLYKSIENIYINAFIQDYFQNIQIPIHILYASQDKMSDEKSLLEMKKYKNISIEKLDSTHQIPLEKQSKTISKIKDIMED